MVFQTFPDKEQALRTAATLENHGVMPVFEENATNLDSNFIGQQFDNAFVLKLPGDQFVLAEQVLMEHTVISMEDVAEDYMLLSFSDSELIDVMKNRKEWGIYNYKLAEKLLQERQVAIPREEIAQARKKELEQEARPQSYDYYWIGFGYLMALFAGGDLYTGAWPALFIYPALFALVVGCRLLLFRKTLSDGRRLYTYRFAVRIHGLLIFIIALGAIFVRLFTRAA